MSSPRQIPRVHSSEIKLLILNKLGRKKAENYFFLLKRLLSLKITKVEFDKLCCSTIGKENIALHNLLIRTILKNACISQSALERETNTGLSRNSKVSSGFSSDVLVASSQRRVSINSNDRGLKDRPSPLGRRGKVHYDVTHEISNPCDPQRPQELISIGSKAFMEVVSVEDGEEVEQVRGSPGVQSRSPVRAPLGIPTRIDVSTRKHCRRGSGIGFHLLQPHELETCCRKSELPDTKTLRKRMVSKMEQEGLSLTVGSADVLNTSLDIYLKEIIKPCIELARARCCGKCVNLINGTAHTDMCATLQKEYVQRPNTSVFASMQDFQVAMELNPRLLGQNWHLWLEKIVSMPAHAFRDGKF